MNQKTWAKFLERDGGCLHCGETEAVSPQHRGNRGMGGSKVLDRPSNVIVLCSEMNWLIESDVLYAGEARAKGWKISKWAVPEDVPVWDNQTRSWFFLDNLYGRTVSL